MEQLNDCCKDPNNREKVWRLTRYQDWEIKYIYCKVCGEVLEEN